MSLNGFCVFINSHAMCSQWIETDQLNALISAFLFVLWLTFFMLYLRQKQEITALKTKGRKNKHVVNGDELP